MVKWNVTSLACGFGGARPKEICYKVSSGRPKRRSEMNRMYMFGAGVGSLIMLVFGMSAKAEPQLLNSASAHDQVVTNSTDNTVPIASTTPPQRVKHGVVTGYVVDEKGEPIEGARVVRLGPSGGETLTDIYGEFRLELAHDDSGPISVVIEKRNGTEVLHAIEVVDFYSDGNHAVLPGVVLRSTCEPRWTEGLFPADPAGLSGGAVRALAVFDDGTGSGPALYAAGDFTSTSSGGVLAYRIAKWDGSSWSALGSGMSGGFDIHIHALMVFDDGSGSGPSLYAGGLFNRAGGVLVNNIAKWDGLSWSALGLGMNGSVFALTVFDDGSDSGPGLYAGGNFSSAGGVPINRVAKWDGISWSSLGEGLTGGSVRALTVFDDLTGSGPALYAGGSFTTTGSVAVNRIARWSGSSWSPLGSGVSGESNSSVNALTVFDDGSGFGPAMYAGGFFSTAGGVSVNHIARWNGSSWSSVGSGMSGDSTSAVSALTVFNDGSGFGPALYAGGSFTVAGGVSSNGIARWRNASWSPLGAGVSGKGVLAFAVINEGAIGEGVSSLYAGGSFLNSSEVRLNNIAKWNNSTWSPLGLGLNGGVLALEVFDDGSGSGPALYVGGNFTHVGGRLVNNIAKWDGFSWSSLGSGVSGRVFALKVFDDGLGMGPALYAGGQFTVAGGIIVRSVAKWDGLSWSVLGNGLNGQVEALAVFDDLSGSGPALYAGGTFTATAAGDVSANRVAKWDGLSWAPLGLGVNNTVRVLTDFDDGSGSGPVLYAGGFFSSAGGLSASRIAKWDGVSWSRLGSGLSGSSVGALAVFDDGSGVGPALYAGGLFFAAAGESVSNIAKWDGVSWSALGTGVNESIFDLTIFDDGSGSGPALYAGGTFTTAGGVSVNRIAKWDGNSWSALGLGLSNMVAALAVWEDNSSPERSRLLYVGGSFTSAGGTGSGRVARWEGCADTTPRCACDINNDGQQTVSDYSTFLTNFFAQLGGPGSADLDGDGVVTISDFFEFLNCLPAIAASEPCP